MTIEECVKKYVNSHANKFLTCLCIALMSMGLIGLICFFPACVINQDAILSSPIGSVMGFVLLFFLAVGLCISVITDNISKTKQKELLEMAYSVLKDLPDANLFVDGVVVKCNKSNSDRQLKSKQMYSYAMQHNDIHFDNPLVLPVDEVHISMNNSDKQQYLCYIKTDRDYPVGNTGFTIPANIVWLGNCRLVLNSLPSGYKSEWGMVQDEQHKN